MGELTREEFNQWLEAGAPHAFHVLEPGATVPRRVPAEGWLNAVKGDGNFVVGDPSPEEFRKGSVITVITPERVPVSEVPLNAASAQTRVVWMTPKSRKEPT